VFNRSISSDEDTIFRRRGNDVGNRAKSDQVKKAAGGLIDRAGRPVSRPRFTKAMSATERQANGTKLGKAARMHGLRFHSFKSICPSDAAEIVASDAVVDHHAKRSGAGEDI